MNLTARIKSLDGQSAEQLSQAYRQLIADNMFIPELISLLAQPAYQHSTSWLLKFHLQDGGSLCPVEISRVYALVDQLQGWEVHLHILQCIPFMPIPTAQRSRVEAFIRRCLNSDKKFVRAWAYNAFYELAVSYNEYQAEANTLFSAAMPNEAASVKARLRQLMRQGFD